MEDGERIIGAVADVLATYSRAQRERNRNHGKEFRKYPQGVAKAECFGKSSI
jgi:hypothetical protein